MRHRSNSSGLNKNPAANDEYQGPLAEPLTTPSLMASPEELDEWNKTIEAKTLLLMQHHGIDPNSSTAFAALASHLASQHVPGFMPPPKQQGRPAERNHDDITLWLLFDLLKRRDGITGRRASELIAKAGVISGTPETLRTRHERWKQKWPIAIEFFERLAQAIGERNVITCLEVELDHLLQKNVWC